MTVVVFKPSGPLTGRVCVPSDKSITHRALMIGGVSEGDTLVRHPLWAGDTRSTAACLQAMGVRISARGGGGRGADPEAGRVPLSGDVIVHGEGLGALRAPDHTMDAGNSGTTLRLLAGLVSGGIGVFTFDGDESLRRRPMDRVVAPLRQMGVAVEACHGRLPLTVRGGEVTATDYTLPVASAQVKSCLLLAGLHAAGATSITEPAPSRDHTERMLAAAGAAISRTGPAVVLQGRARLCLEEVTVPGDPSSAAFLVAAAAMIPESDLTVTGVGLNPTRMGFFEVLREMGACIEWNASAGPGRCDEALGAGAGGGIAPGEPAGDIRVRYAPLHGTTVSGERVPLLIDELPLLALVATAAGDATLVEGAGELRHKETDRLDGIGRLLTALGARVEIAEDSFRVLPSGVLGGSVGSGGDHRLAMLGAVAGLASRTGVTVAGFEAAGVSFPSFQQTLTEVLRQ